MNILNGRIKIFEGNKRGKSWGNDKRPEKEVYITKFEPFTLKHFDVEVGNITESSWGKWYRVVITVRLRENLAKALIKHRLATNTGSYHRRGETTWHTSRSSTIEESYDFRGCRSEEAKKKKSTGAKHKVITTLYDDKDKIVNELVEQFNAALRKRFDFFNKEYTETWVEVLSGEQLSEEWRAENVDNDEIKTLDTNVSEAYSKMKELKDEIRKLHEKCREERNVSMLAFLKKNKWKVSAEQPPLPDVVIDRVREILESNKGFRTDLML